MADQLILGRNVIVQFKDLNQEGYWEYVCATDCSIETTIETKSTKTVGDGVWGRKKPQKIDYTVSLSGLIKLFDEEGRNTVFNVLSAMIGFVEMEYRMVFTDPETGLIKVITGTVLATRNTLSAGASGFATGEFILEGTGPYTLNDSFIGCVGTVGEVVYNGGSITMTDIPPDTVRIDYTVDGGGISSAFPEDGTVSIILFLDPGDHIVILTPICANGEAGEPYELEFTISEGGCALVENIPLGLPDGEVGEPYSHTITLSGDEPFTIDNIVKPSWMTVSLLGDEVSFTGTPDEASASETVSFFIGNCSAAGSAFFVDTIVVTDPAVQSVLWQYEEIGASTGEFIIELVAVEVVNVTTDDSGSFPISDTNGVTSRVNGPAFSRRTLFVKNETTGNVLHNVSTTTGNQAFNFIVTDGNTYSVIGTVEIL